jgi:CheY-specific phosphatase CheX
MTISAPQLEQIEKFTKDAVKLVFQTMLSMEVATHSPIPESSGEVEIISSVGFIGEVTGSIYLCTNVNLARFATCRMLGLAEHEIDSDTMVNDVLGELGNMIVGHVKSRLCDQGNDCTLTIPSIVRGRRLSVERPTNVAARMLAFTYQGSHFVVEILVKEKDL